MISAKRSLSLRARLTLTVLLIIALMAAALTLLSMFNANSLLFSPPTTTYEGESAMSYSGPEAATNIVNASSGQAEAAVSFNRLSVSAMLAIIILGGAITYVAVGKALRPLQRLSKEIGSMGENALSVRLSGGDAGDEIGTLVNTFNRLLCRLEKAFGDQKGFASAAAHELKTPLAAIKANVDVLEMDKMPALCEYENLARVAKTQTNRMIRLVDDLFTISMGEAYDFTDSLLLPMLIPEIVKTLSPTIQEKRLSVNVHSQVHHPLLCSAAMVRHALSNIIENAVKYNVEGGSVDITLLETDRQFIVTVADSGIGIPAEHRERVFDAFYRVDTSRSRKMGGAGLGLSIARNMVERHAGRISVWENDGKGTVFTVELPKASVKKAT